MQINCGSKPVATGKSFLLFRSLFMVRPGRGHRQEVRFGSLSSFEKRESRSSPSKRITNPSHWVRLDVP